MRTSILAVLAALSLAMAPARGDQIIPPPDLTIALDSPVGSGSPASGTPTPGFCVQPDCVLFTGTLTDNDDDLSFMLVYDISASFASAPGSGALSLDSNTFYDNAVGYLVGDPEWSDDSMEDDELQNYYYGPIFGIDIAPETTAGIYDGTVTIYTSGGTNDSGNGQTFTADFTVDVLAPEPSAFGLMMAGILPLSAWFGIKKRKWHFSAASR